MNLVRCLVGLVSLTDRSDVAGLFGGLVGSSSLEVVYGLVGWRVLDLILLVGVQ